VVYREVLQIAAESLSAHKLRTFLTMLGIIIGVAAVIAMLAIGEGAKQEVLEQISILGINNIIVNAKVPAQSAGSDQGLQRSPGLSEADGENIAEFQELVANVVVQRFEPIGTIYRGSNQAAVRVVATEPNFVYSSSIDVEDGRFITDLDIEDFNQVCVLGAKAKRALFAFEDAVGETVRIGDLDFTVVGVMTDKYIGRGKVEGLQMRNLNEDVYIPFSTAKKKFDRTDPAQNVANRGFIVVGTSASDQAYNTPDLDQLTVTVAHLDFVEAVARLIRRILERRHGGVDDYEIVVPESLLRQTEKTQRIFNLVMGAIAGLSLLVGGIGIMNIMLATVLERTREIGIRRAVGARRGEIMRQFLIEAVVICLFGCCVGLALGFLITKIISFYAGWPTIVSIFSVVLAVGVSTCVGVVFGIFPAHQAARLNVIDSLRYE
jgi:putative ABC transport system permease protein